jgi:hypothetical protein
MSESAYTEPDIASLLGLVDTYCRWKDLQQKGSRRYFAYHPSEWGKCLRKQQYKHFVQMGIIPSVPAEGFGGQQIRLFDTGHTMHHRWQQDYFSNMGILRGVWKCGNAMCYAFDDEGNPTFDSIPEDRKQRVIKGHTRLYGREELQGIFRPEKCVCGYNEFEYVEATVRSEEYNFEGHCDLILDFSKFDPEQFPGVRKTFNEKVFPKRPIVVDMKTTGDWQWKNQVMKSGIHKEYIIQLTIYIHLLDCEYGVVIYENKSDSQAIAFKVERNERRWDEIKRQALMMRRMSEKRILPPPRPTDQDVMECQKCEFLKVCTKSNIWDDPKLEEKRKAFYGSLL